MASTEVQTEQTTTELKYLGLWKKIIVRFVVVISNVYDYAKESSGDYKTTIESIENKVVPTFSPIYKNLKELAEQTFVFVDDKFDTLAPSFIKKLATEFNNLIYEAKPLAKRIVTITQAITTPPISATIFFLQTTKYFIQSITPLQKRSTTTETPAKTTPGANTTTSSATGSILQTGTGLASQAGGILGNVTGAVSSATQNVVGSSVSSNATKLLLQTAYKTIQLTTIPVIAQVWYQINKEHPTFAEFSEFVLPVVEAVAKLYNKTVEFTDERGFTISGYLPLIPVDEMKAAYKLVKTTGAGLSAVGDLAGAGLSTVGNVLGGVSGGLSGVGDVAGAGLSAVTDVAGGLTGGLSSVTDVAGGLTGGLSSVTDVAGGLTGGLSSVSDVAGGLTGGLSGVTDVAGGLTGGLSSVTDVAGTGLSGVGDVAGGVTEGLSAVTGGLSSVGGLFGSKKT